MRRKEVLVDRNVFGLGLDDIFTAAQKGKTLTLDVGPTIFSMGVSQERSVILHWTGLTNIQNIIWLRFVVMRFHRPPIQSISCYTTK